VSDDLKLVELVAARLCHDLVGPVGAIVNGVELLGDGAADPEVTALIADSARRASRRLQVYRVAYGSANSLASSRRLDECRRLIQALCETQPNVKLEWLNADDATEQATGRTCAKITLIFAMVAADVLPRGGALRVRHAVQPGERISLSVVAEGAHARLPDDVQAAFEPTLDESPSPKAAPVVVALRLARAAGGNVSLSPGAGDRVEIGCVLPAGA
jgi:histidine phosphotransferase ChpT